MKYYSDDREDRFVHRFFDLPEKGVFVDVGAADGVKGNNTYFFEKLGWTGICIDADPRNMDSLKKKRKIAIQALISSVPKSGTPLFMNEKDATVSGIISNNINDQIIEYFDAVELETILEERSIDKIDLLSVDTEGSELDVLMSFDIEKHDPKIIIIEYITHGKVSWEAVDYLDRNDYVIEATKGSNQIMRKKDMKL